MRAKNNVVLITIDCLRGDHVGCIGGKELTPNIDALAKKSVVFKKAYANGSATSQSFPAIFTSTYFFMNNGLRLSPYYVTLPEILRQRKFRTLAFHSNPYLSKVFGWNKGFDEFYDFLDYIKSPTTTLFRKGLMPKFFKMSAQMLEHNQNMLLLLRKIHYHLLKFQIPYIDAESLNKFAIKFIKEVRSPFFLWMHYMDPHEPYIPPEEYLKGTGFSNRKEAFAFNVMSGLDPRDEDVKILKNLYEQEIRYVDRCVGDLIELLRDKEVINETLIVILADHGQEFKEHGIFGHGKSLYNKVLHVPLIIYGLNESATIEKSVQLLDIPPTILDALGFKAPKFYLGKSLLPLIKEGESSEIPIYSENAKQELSLRYDLNKIAVSCILDKWKLIIDEIEGKIELYNLEKDQDEKENLIEEQGQIGKELESLIDVHLKKEKQIQIRKRIFELDSELTTRRKKPREERKEKHIPSKAEEKEIKERLKRLGYL